jgi:hypothetical protein
MCECDRCDYRSAAATIEFALRDLPAGDAARRAYGQAALARVHLRTGRFNFWHPDLVTLHLWLWYPNPAGLYSGTNPYIKPFNHT